MMTPEQSAALINSQAALLFAEISAMNAQNLCLSSTGQPPAFDGAAFEKVTNQYWRILRADCANFILINGELA